VHAYVQLGDKVYTLQLQPRTLWRTPSVYRGAVGWFCIRAARGDGMHARPGTPPTCTLLERPAHAYISKESTWKCEIFTHMAWHGAERDCYETVKLSYTIIFSNGECWSPSLLLLIHFPCHDHLCLQFIVHQHLLWFHRLINFVPKPSFIVFASLASLLASYFYRAFLHFFLILTHHRPIGKIPLSSMDLHAPTTSTSHYAQTISVVA
jgi:hypothetical protein